MSDRTFIRAMAIRHALAALFTALALLIALDAWGQKPEPLPPIGEPAPAWTPVPVEEGEAKPPVDAASSEVEKEEHPGPGLSAIGLCTQRQGDGDTEARCDLGVAVPVKAWMFKRDPKRGVALVGFLGGNVTGTSEGEGLGVAGVGGSLLFPIGERTGGVGVGWSVEWGGNGIDLGEGRLTFGFTIGGRR